MIRQVPKDMTTWPTRDELLEHFHKALGRQHRGESSGMTLKIPEFLCIFTADIQNKKDQDKVLEIKRNHDLFRTELEVPCSRNRSPRSTG